MNINYNNSNSRTSLSRLLYLRWL